MMAQPKLCGSGSSIGGCKLLWDSVICDYGDVNWLGKHIVGTCPLISPFWFVRDLMVVSVCTPLLYWLLRRFRLWVVAVFGLCFISRVFIPVHGFSSMCFLWFSFGAYFSIWGKDLVAALYRFCIPAGVVAVLTAMVLVWTWGTHWSPFVGECLRQVSNLYILASVVTIINLVAYLVREKGIKGSHWLSKTSFVICAAHIMILQCVWPRLVPWVDGVTWRMFVSFPCVPAFVVGVCLAFYWFMERIAPRLLSLLTGNRR